jgi:hypothetical protein
MCLRSMIPIGMDTLPSHCEYRHLVFGLELVANDDGW